MFVQMVHKEATYFISKWFINRYIYYLYTRCTSWWDIAKRWHFLCQKCFYTICLLCSVSIGNQNLFGSYRISKWIWPFCVNPLLHDILIALSFLLKHNSHAFLFLLCSDSKTFSPKHNCRSNPINTIIKYSKLHCCFCQDLTVHSVPKLLSHL